MAEGEILHGCVESRDECLGRFMADGCSPRDRRYTIIERRFDAPADSILPLVRTLLTLPPQDGAEAVPDDDALTLSLPLAQEPEGGCQHWRVTSAPSGGCTLRVEVVLDAWSAGACFMGCQSGSMRDFTTGITLLLDHLDQRLGTAAAFP
ncbi:MAG: hypothetical protein RLY86_1663 [Pseudomonadota bacterium]|jgi:hypothetical protein